METGEITCYGVRTSYGVMWCDCKGDADDMAEEEGLSKRHLRRRMTQAEFDALPELCG